MQRLWSSFLQPVTEAVRPGVVVEVGSRFGLNTRNILEYCRDHGARAEIIDPFPPANLEQIRELLGSFGRFHQKLSLEVLADVPGDLFLIDGDHNWYTVYHELRMIERAARDRGRPLPVICLHDVEWPYARRDLYHDPSTIPAEHRRPYAKRGIALDRSELCAQGGYNFRHLNALSEGGPENGVLTAVDDFVKTSTAGWRFARIPAYHGLGVLWAPAQLPPEIERRLSSLVLLPDHVMKLLENLERSRLDALTQLLEEWRLLGGKPGPNVVRLVRWALRLRGRRFE